MLRRLPALLALVFAARAGAQAQRPATSALGALIDAAARDNKVPPALQGYHASVESEIGIALRRETGQEMLVGVEQIASTLRWQQTGEYEQHVVGYRARQSVPTSSTLATLRSGWVTPVLYGDRLLPPRPPGDSARARRRVVRRNEPPTVAVHPLASDRERYYQFSGGDTVVTLRTPRADGSVRAIPIVRIHVEPREEIPASPSVILFLGDIDLDVERHVIVRMRGQYLVAARPPRGLRGRIERAALQGYAFVEYETAERGGQFWLPTYQRVEFQVVSPLLGDSRAVMRIVSRVRDVTLDTVPNVVATVNRTRSWWRLTRAGQDSLSRYDGWNASLGTLTGATHADDFDDVAPDAWRLAGPPRVEPYFARTSDLARFNRVEGLFTGAGARVRFRDAAPGLVLRAAGGWAWAEQTARGRVELEQTLGTRRPVDSVSERWSIGVRAARSLDATNDFRNPFDTASSIGALIGSVDDYDYVDRRLATAFVRRVSRDRAATIRLELGGADDRGAAANVRRGIFGPDDFLPNRGVDAGRYLRTAVIAELHPDVAAEFVRPGIGTRLSYERGDGDLQFQRVELRLTGRAELAVPWPNALRGSTLTTVARGDAGALFGHDELPAQQLFELGGAQSLQGYEYKTFAGDRAGVLRGAIVYGSPWLRAPIRFGRFALPGIAPGLSVSAEAGWASATSDAARRAITRLGIRPPPDSTLLASWVPVPVSRPSDGVRATVNLGVRLFGGSIFVGAARPIDQHTDRRSGWRAVFGVGTGL